MRLGDGSAESHRRMQGALDALYPFSLDLLAADDLERDLSQKGLIPDPDETARAFEAELARSLAEATLTLPERRAPRTGGRKGVHTEHMGYLLAEMQHLHRSHPGARW